jgi:hypothetical protein
VVVCHYGETNDVFLIGGLVFLSETLVVCTLRHYSPLAWFHFPERHRLYLYQVFDGTVNQESAKIFMFVKDVTMSEMLRHLRRRWHAGQLGINVQNDMDRRAITSMTTEPLSPPSLIKHTYGEKEDEATVSHWIETIYKILCFDFTEIVSPHVIENNMLLASQMDEAPLRWTNSICVNMKMGIVSGLELLSTFTNEFHRVILNLTPPNHLIDKFGSKSQQTTPVHRNLHFVHEKTRHT